MRYSSLRIPKKRTSIFAYPLHIKMLALLLLCVMLSSYINFTLKSPAGLADGSKPYWDNSYAPSAIGFGALPKTVDNSPNVVTLKTFMTENGTNSTDSIYNPNSGFALLSKYKSGSSFDPNSCVIMLESAADLLQWSKNSFFRYDSTANPTLERSVYLSAHYVLGNNIDYGTTTGFIPIGFRGGSDANQRFTGTFDGQGFEITNLKLTQLVAYFLDESANPCFYYSMFSNIGAGGVVKNLGLRSPTYTEPYGVNLSLRMGGIAGYNRGTVQYCFVVAGAALHTTAYDASEIAGLAHTNDGTLDNVYFAGAIANSANRDVTKYNPVVFTNNGTVSNTYYDGSIYGTTVNTVYASVVSKTTAELQARTGILSADPWYTDNYNRNITGYAVGYPRLQGFKYNNAVNNSTTNPFYLQRPADLIFFSNALTAYATFGNSTSRYFRLLNCLDMSTVSETAYITPDNDFYGNFEGTIDDNSKSCIAHHVGTGDQLNGHSIINLRITIPLFKLITATNTQYILMGLTFNNGVSTATFKNLNIVGGYIKMPALTESQASNSFCSLGMLITYSRYALLENVHNSADVIATGNGDYIAKLRMGGLVGGLSYTVNAYKCSNSGTIDAGTHIFVSTSAQTFSVGGLIGEQGTTGSIKRFEDCVNYGSVMGITITANQTTGLAGSSYVGGICGYSGNTAFTLDRVYNEGSIYSLTDLPDGATAFSIVPYYAGGLFGMSPSGPTSVAAGVTPSTDTRMCNKGTVYANKISNTTAGAAAVGGIAGSSPATSNAWKQVANAGTITIAKDILSVYAAGITNGAIYLYDCYNDGTFATENNLALAPIYETRIFGLSGGSNNNSGNNYILSSCYNMKDITVNISNATATVRISGLAYNMPMLNCVNSNKIEVNTDTLTGILYVSGIADGSINAVNSTNNGQIKVSVLDQSSIVAVGGVICAAQNGTANGCINNGLIIVERKFKNSTNTNQPTYIGGIKVGSTSNSTDITIDCQNNGEIDFDSYFTSDASAASKAGASSNVYIAGVQVFTLSANRCINNGDLVLAKNYDFTGTNAYVAGVIYSSNLNNDSNTIQSCRNLKPIYNVNNIGVSVNTATRSIYFDGIIHYGSSNMTRLVNQGDITMTSWNSSNNVNFYVNGVVDYTGNIDSNRVNYGVKGLANVGKLKIDHSQSELPQNNRVVISGIIRQLGVGDSRYVSVLPFENLINSGEIIALAKTDTRAYIIPGNDAYTATSANVIVGGISAMPAYYAPNSATYPADSIPLKSSSNTANITVDLVCGSASPSKTIIYNVGGIAASTASNSSGYANQKLDIYDCTNGGNITVNALNDTVSNYGISGVGGIVGFGYQYTNGVTTANESNIHSSIYNCINFGNIEGGYSTGGIVGCDGAIIKNVINFGTVKGTNNASVGGILGAVRSARKNSNNTRLLLALDGVINYGSVQASASNTPQYMGGIIGNIAIGQDASYGTRRYERILNTTGVKFVGNTTAQLSARTTFGVNTLIDVVNAMPSPGPLPAWETSSAFFTASLISKTNGAVTDSNSIYYKDTGNDSNSFFWRVGETLPENNNWFVYLTSDKSSRNTYDSQSGSYLPYNNGIYALAVNTGKISGYYPSSNTISQNCDPLLSSGYGYTAWRTTLIGSASVTVDDALRSLRQIKLNTDAEILSLQLIGGGVSLKSAEVVAAESKVVFYVVKDNFAPTVYVPDIYSTNTVISDKASFDGNVNIDLSGGMDFDSINSQPFVLTVKAEDGGIKYWNIEIRTVLAQPPLTLLQIKEGISIANSSATYSLHPFSARAEALSYELGNVVSTHNDTLIFNFNTVGLLPGKNMINDISIQTDAGVLVNPGAASGGIGSANTTYYKVPAPASYGVDSYNYKIISSDYTTYQGTLTVNINLHSNLSSGNYRVAINTVYGTYYYYFTRVASSEAEIQVSPNVLLLTGTVGCSINSGAAQVYNAMSGASSRIQYGNAPDISKVTAAYGMFSSNPTISKNATISAQRLISITDTDPVNKPGSKTYVFAFSITSENGTKKDWTINIVTQPYVTPPVAIEVDYNGTTYAGSQVNDPDIMYDTFVINKNQTGSFMVKFDTTNGSTGSNAFQVIKDNNYFVYEVYRNSVLIPSSEYVNYGLTIAKQPISGNYLKVSIDAGVTLPNGSYELRTYYYRPPVAINPSVTDASNNTYSQLQWTDAIQYPSFYFFKAEGKKLSFATGLTVPYVPDIFTFKNGTTNLIWDGTYFNYDALGSDITTEEKANYKVHRQFNIVYKYKTDVFYYNFKPQFLLPEGATLYRETLANQWELVTADNLAADFSNGKVIKYRVYAEDTRYYQDYTIQLLTVLKTKQFNMSFEFQNGASNTLPVSATLKSIDRDANNNNIVFGNITVFSEPGTTYGLEKLPPGSYVLNVDVPYGYQASIIADNSPTENDIYVNGKLIAGNWKMVTAMTDLEQNFSIRVIIEPIPNFNVPWGIRRIKSS